MSADLFALADEIGVPCWRLTAAAARHEARRLRGNTRYYLSARPLLALRHENGSERAFCARCDVNAATYHQWRCTGLVEVHTADRVAVHLGLHPASIWRDQWWALSAFMGTIPSLQWRRAA